MKKYGLMIVVFLFAFSSIALSQIQLNDSGYLQDFNTLADSGSSSVLPNGWYLFESGSSADSEYTAGTGSSGGNTYSYGSAGDTERALGGLRTGSLIPTFGANFINNSSNIITLLHISYAGEQWRIGSSTRTEPDTIKFQYSLNATGLSDGDWIDVNQLDFASPIFNTTTGSLDGNLQENRREINYTITGLSIPDGAEFWIRWKDVDVSSADDGLAIDDFHIDLTTPDVTFSLAPSSLHFDTVDVGSSSTLHATIKNEGTTDDLVITNIESTNPVFNLLPNTLPVTLAPGDSEVFDITFTPSGNGPETGTMSFTHNAPGSPSSLSLYGIGQAQLSGGLLKFKSPERNLLDGTAGNPDTVVLSDYSGKSLKALQFNLIIGNSNGGLILRSVARGSAIPANQFNFSYEIFRGSYLPDGSSVDTVKIVILGNGANAITSSQNDQDLIVFSYDIVSISGVSLQTFNHLSEVKGATISPVTDAELGTGPDETINILNGTLEGILGDVNMDNQVNILDILLMIDYIIDRVEFSSNQFFNGDISPWTPDDPLPTRDGKIDVLDLAVLQNIVLTGTYPSKSPVHKTGINSNKFAVNRVHKLTPGMDTKVTFYFTRDGISIGLESLKKVKGLQIELNNLGLSIPQNTKMNSIFNQALYYQEDSFLRMLSYDDHSAPLSEGEYLIASIPFNLNNPQDLVVENLIVAGEDNNYMEKVETEIVYENPSIPENYSLSQNYPNPFNPATLIKFSIPKDEFVTIKVYNIIGQQIITLFSGNKKAGTHSLSWNGMDQNGKQVSSGSYIYRMTAGEFNQSKKMIYMK